MKTLHTKILWGLGVPVILFVIALLIVNFFYVDHQIKQLTYSYVNSIALEADNKLTVKVKEIEELAKVLADYLRQDRYIDEARILGLLANLLDDDEKYDIFIVRRPLVIEGYIQGKNQSKLLRRILNSSDESKYQRYLELAPQQDTWSQLRLEKGNWKTSYVVPYETVLSHTNGVIIVDVSLYELVKNLLNIKISKNAKIAFSVRQKNGETNTLLLDTKTSNKLEPLPFDLPDIQDAGDDINSMPGFLTHATQINDPLNGKGQTFIAQLPASFSPNVQLIALLPKEDVFLYIYRAKFVESITVLVAFLGLVLLIMLISKSISKPLSTLVKKVEVLAAGNLNMKFPVTDSCIELNNLSTNLNQTVGQLKTYFSDLKQVTAQNEKINSEINISHDVQLSLLPHRKEHNEIDNLDIHACTLPAKKVGGDFYYFFKIDQNSTALVIGDVSGKGMPAAIMMAVCLSLFKAQSANTPRPDICLQKINHFLMQEEDNNRCAFVTLFYAIVNTSNGELIYANAGHNPPLIVRKTGTIEFLNQEHGVALAVTENARYKVQKARLGYGDTLLLYTDGITEAHDMKEEEFGEQRLIECMAQHGVMTDTQPARHCVQNIVRNVARFIRGCVQFDDMTLLCAVMRETTEDLPHADKQLQFDNLKSSIGELRDLQFRHRLNLRYDIQEINKIVDLIDTLCSDYRINSEVAADLCVAIDEFVSNIIRHGQSDKNNEFIEVRFAKKENVLYVVLEYRGKAFDPLQIPSLDIHGDWRKRRLGGLGIYIGQQLIDRSAYAHSDGRNILMIAKKIQD